ncbi:30S ribosomal protein S19e [Halobacteriales archaeon SW_10_68_16]|jgi:small subunit ribosomal protein S19e|nr:MAG: 30S ribosomal protein S19e [Halobacteriales archaeon SW_10_68_16]
MTTLYDVPADALIEAIAADLAEDSNIEQPDSLAYAKSSADRELPPEQDDFWTRRAASILRKVAVDGPVGVGSLRTTYGTAKQGSNRYRVRPRRKAQSSGKIIRVALQQLEDAGHVETAEGEGRVITSEGQSFLDEVAAEVMDDLDDPDLARYA